jgi:tryptophanyl-tRNA synthetase
LGIDGRKMSKSYRNAIYLCDPPQIIRQKVSQMFTDESRLRKTDPGHPNICGVFFLHKLYTPTQTVAQIELDCRKAKIGCVECKKRLAENLVLGLAPLQQKRHYYQSHKDKLKEIIEAGINKARTIASLTLEEVKEAIGIHI